MHTCVQRSIPLRIHHTAHQHTREFDIANAVKQGDGTRGKKNDRDGRPGQEDELARAMVSKLRTTDIARYAPADILALTAVAGPVLRLRLQALASLGRSASADEARAAGLAGLHARAVAGARVRAVRADVRVLEAG